MSEHIVPFWFLRMGLLQSSICIRALSRRSWIHLPDGFLCREIALSGYRPWIVATDGIPTVANCIGTNSLALRSSCVSQLEHFGTACNECQDGYQQRDGIQDDADYGRNLRPRVEAPDSSRDSCTAEDDSPDLADEEQENSDDTDAEGDVCVYCKGVVPLLHGHSTLLPWLSVGRLRLILVVVSPLVIRRLAVCGLHLPNLRLT